MGYVNIDSNGKWYISREDGTEIFPERFNTIARAVAFANAYDIGIYENEGKYGIPHGDSWVLRKFRDEKTIGTEYFQSYELAKEEFVRDYERVVGIPCDDEARNMMDCSWSVYNTSGSVEHGWEIEKQ